MRKKVLVIGGAGFLGSHVADALTTAGCQVTIFDRRASEHLQESQEMIAGDILHAPSVREAVNGQDAVYHFAGLADLDSSATQPLETVRQNIEGTLNVLEACRETGVKRFVYASTIYVYSDKGGFYRCSKQSAELYIEEFQRKHKLPFTILRFGTLYGPRATDKNSVHRYVRQALTDKKIRVPGDGEEIREYIHVLDAAKLSVKILSDEFANGHYIITGHHPIRMKQLVETIKEMVSGSLEVEYLPGTNPDHYRITPYAYSPRAGRKITTDCYIDLGQGLLDAFQDIQNKQNYRSPDAGTGVTNDAPTQKR